MIGIDYKELANYANRKRYPTYGNLPMPKKMWRDGYNKAVFDLITFIHMNDKLRKGTAESEV